MTLLLESRLVPLRRDEYGVIRVGDSQVLLDVVIREYQTGTSPEEIAQAYSTLDLADIHEVIAYYLRHRGAVDQYLQARRDEADQLRQEIEAKRLGGGELKAKLLDVSSVEPRDDWERRLFGAALDCGVSVPDCALSSDGLYE
jgi:uncharacterized protein (DUF433 family)